MYDLLMQAKSWVLQTSLIFKFLHWIGRKEKTVLSSDEEWVKERGEGAECLPLSYINSGQERFESVFTSISVPMDFSNLDNWNPLKIILLGTA